MFTEGGGTAALCQTAPTQTLLPQDSLGCDAGGVVSASKASIHRVLTDGHSLAVHVGGIAEMFVVHEDKESIILKNRRGFLKMAVEHGVPVIPVYHFGNSHVVKIFPRCVCHRCS